MKHRRDDVTRGKRRANVEHLAGIIRQLRADRGLTLRALSDQSGVDLAYLSRVENAFYDQPSVLNLRDVATALGVAPIELLLAAGYVQPSDLQPMKKGGSS